MNDYYAIWVEQLAKQSRIGVILAAAAINVILVVRLARPDRRAWLLRLAAGGYVLLAGIILAAGWLSGELPVPTGGLLLHKPLWYDETFTALVASLPMPRMLAAVAGDVHPPLWYLIEWAVVRLLGHSEAALRLPALLFGVVSAYLTYRLALALNLRQEAAILAAVFLALMPAQVYYSQEARMYTLLQAAVLLAALGIATRRPWVMAAGMTIALYAHNLGGVYVALLVGLHIWIEGLATWPLPLASVAIVYLPWLPITLAQATDVANGFWLPAYDVGGYISEWVRTAIMGAPANVAVPLALLVIGLAALVWWVVTRCTGQMATSVAITAALAFGPPLILVMISTIFRPMFLHRALLPTLPFLSIGTAAAIGMLPGDCRRIILVVVALSLILSVGIVQKREGEMARWLADQVRDQCRAGATLWHANLASYIGLAYYLPDCRQAVWPDAGNLSQALTISTQRAMGITRAKAADIDGDILVIWIENPMTTPEEISALEAALSLGQAELIVSEYHLLMKLQVWKVVR